MELIEVVYALIAVMMLLLATIFSLAIRLRKVSRKLNKTQALLAEYQRVFRRSDFVNGVWKKLKIGERMTFSVDGGQFNYMGEIQKAGAVLYTGFTEYTPPTLSHINVDPPDPEAKSSSLEVDRVPVPSLDPP